MSLSAAGGVLHGVTEFGIHSPWEDDAPLRRIHRVGYCGHRQVRLDRDARRVFCKACGREVDPFEVLNHLAWDHERYEQARAQVRRELAQAEQELADVKRELRNAKARRRRAER